MLVVDDILKRIQTFSSYTWTVRYKQLSPYKCAIHGFINSGLNEIQCQICTEKIKIEDPYEGSYDPVKVLDLVARYKNQLKTVHAEECFFHNQNNAQKISIDYFYQQWRIHYNNNYYSYGNQESIELPLISPKVLEYIGEKSVDIMNLKGSIIESSIVEVPKILSIFGWRYLKGSRAEEAGQDQLNCDFCGRCVDILAYKTQSGRMQNLSEVSDNLEYTSGKFVPIFDPLQEHKYYCKWAKPRVIDHTKQYGWTICIEMLRYSAITEGKDFKDRAEEGRTHENIEEEKVHESILAEQTKFKLEILNNMQELKSLKEKTFKKCEDIIKSSEKLGLQESKKYSDMIEHHRTKLEDLIKELDLKVDPEKRIKTT